MTKYLSPTTREIARKYSATIKEIRASLKISQAEMARRLGIHVQTLSKYERGEQIPSVETLTAIAEKLGVSGSWLVTGHGEMMKSPKELAKRRTRPIIERIKKALNLVNDSELENELGIGQGKIVSIIEMHNDLPYDRIADLCDKRGLSLDWLLTGEGIMFRNPRGKASIDHAFLKEIMVAIEKISTHKKIRLSLQKKAELASLLYDDLLDNPDRDSILKEKVAKLAKLAS